MIKEGGGGGGGADFSMSWGSKTPQFFLFFWQCDGIPIASHQPAWPCHILEVSHAVHFFQTDHFRKGTTHKKVVGEGVMYTKKRWAGECCTRPGSASWNHEIIPIHSCNLHFKRKQKATPQVEWTSRWRRKWRASGGAERAVGGVENKRGTDSGWMKRTSTVTMGRPCKEERREGGEGHLVIVTLANRRRTRGSARKNAGKLS